MASVTGLSEAVREALEAFPEVRFAVVFGSAAAGRLRRDSDLDVAVYHDSGRALEIEAEREIEGEVEIQLAIDRYRSDRDARRSMDRWVETLITATIDVAKVVLASEHRRVAQTYAQLLADLETMPAFSRLAGRLRPLAALRYLMAHEYLDLRFGKVKDFAQGGCDAVAELGEATRKWLSS